MVLLKFRAYYTKDSIKGLWLKEKHIFETWVRIIIIVILMIRILKRDEEQLVTIEDQRSFYTISM